MSHLPSNLVIVFNMPPKHNRTEKVDLKAMWWSTDLL